MNITKNQIDDLNLQVVMKIEAADYAEESKKKLAEIRRKADIKGFRKGMVPPALIAKMYGGQVLYESVNAVIAKGLNDFVNENKLNIVGEPLPSEDQPQNEWVAGGDFEFHFDMATTPEVNFTIGKDDKITLYQITVSKDAKAAMKNELLQQAGSMEEIPESVEDGHIIADLDNGAHKVEDAYILIRRVAEAARPQFIGLKVGDVLDIDVYAAFENEGDRAARLKVKKEELASLDPAFKLTVVNVKNFVPGTECQETYDKLFGKDAVKTPAEFETRAEEIVRSRYAQQANARFDKDARDYLLKKADIALPEAFLKRWLIYVNDGKYTAEQVEAEFDAFLADFRWQMVRGHVLRLFDLKVEDDDVKEAAYGYARYQYSMYGMNDVPDALLEDLAHRILSDEKQKERLYESVEDHKALQAVRENVTLQNKKISEDKFREL